MITSVGLRKGQLIIVDGEEMFVPFDVSNRHYLEGVDWLKNNGFLSLETEASAYDLIALTLKEKSSTEPVINWHGLGRDLFSSKLSQEIITPIKQSTAPIAQQGAIWDTADKIQGVITLSYYPDQDRIAVLKEYMTFLLKTIQQAGIEIPEATKQEVIEIFTRNGFLEIAQAILNGNS